MTDTTLNKLLGLTANELLIRLLTVDGAGSGLDADYLDGQHASFYRNATNLNAGFVPTSVLPAFTGDVTSAAGSNVLTLAAGTVTVAKMGAIAANSMIANNTGASAAPTAVAFSAINVGSATKLQTARSIALSGVATGSANFDGSANISITTAMSTNHGSTAVSFAGSYDLNVEQPVGYFTAFTGTTASGGPGGLGTSSYFMQMARGNIANRSAQMIADENNAWYVRTSNVSNSWNSWGKLWHSGNFTPGNYATTASLASYALLASPTFSGKVTNTSGLSLGGTAGNFQDLAELSGVASPNIVKLMTRVHRRTAGTDYTTAAVELRHRVDSTDYGFIRFHGTDKIAFGDGTTERHTLSSTNAVIGTPMTVTGNIAVFGYINNYIGALNTQSVVRNMGWQDGWARWRDLIEADTSFALYGYDAAGANGVRIAQYSTTVSGGSNYAKFFGDVVAQAPTAALNSNIFLRDDAGVHQGLLFWDRGTDTVRLRRYNAAGAAAEGELALGATDMAWNGNNVWHAGNLNPASFVAFTWTTVSADVATAVTNTGYIVQTGGALKQITLPATAPAGFNIQVVSQGGQTRIVMNGNTLTGLTLGDNIIVDAGTSITLVARAAGAMEVVANMTAAAGGGSSGSTPAANGNSFPASPADNQLFRRTDRNMMEYFYSAAAGQWLSTQEFPMGGDSVGVVGNSSSGAILKRMPVRGDYGIYITRTVLSTFVQTTNSLASYWNVNLDKFSGTNVQTTVASTTTITGGVADTVNNWVNHDIVVNAVLDPTARECAITATKTGTPGALFFTSETFYRLIG